MFLSSRSCSSKLTWVGGCGNLPSITGQKHKWQPGCATGIWSLGWELVFWNWTLNLWMWCYLQVDSVRTGNSLVVREKDTHLNWCHNQKQHTSVTYCAASSLVWHYTKLRKRFLLSGKLLDTVISDWSSHVKRLVFLCLLHTILTQFPFFPWRPIPPFILAISYGISAFACFMTKLRGQQTTAHRPTFSLYGLWGKNEF